MRHLSYLNRYFWKYRGRFLLGIVFTCLANWFKVWQPQVIRDALDTVVAQVRFFRENGGMEAYPEALGQIGIEVGRFGLLLIALAVLMGIFMFFMRQTIVVMSRLIEYDLRKMMYGHYQRLDTAFYKRNSTGDLMSRISEDVSKVRMYLGPAVLYSIDLVFLFGLTITSMLRVSPTLTLWSLAPLPLLSVSIYVVSNIINRKSTKIQEQLATLTSNAQEVYSGIRVVKSYAQEDAMSRWFADQSELYRRKSLELVRVDAFFFPLMMLMIGASIIITIYVGGLQVVAGNITPGNIAEFVIYINMLTWPVTAIGWIASITQQAAASQKRINEFLNTQPAIVNPQTDQDGPLLGHIVFDRVSFRYPDTGILALDQVSFDVKPGEKMAIVGRTGSGKTTIAELLTRMYDVSEGRILIDGIDLREHNTDNLRRRIGYVPQDMFLFSDSVLANIAFGTEKLSRGEARFFAESAAIHAEIEELKDGYDTVVGERGVTLSGGQKQRLSIARAFAKQPDIVILDDCLSAVDTRTESQILGYLNEVLSDKTAIVITHRIYSSLSFDKIIVLDKGRVVESGVHEELIARQGYYAEMFEKQSA